MNITITYQKNYSRGSLLLRTFFGWLYIGVPHLFLLLFAQLWSGIISFIAWWAILFTGKYPRSFWEYNLGLQKWALRVNAVLYNLVDEYPEFGTRKNNDNRIANIDMEYPEFVGRGSLLLRTFLGIFYVMLPHIIVLAFRSLATSVLTFLAWWSVLFTGNYPESWHRFNVGTLRWATRVNLYMSFLTNTYPPFSGH